MILRSGRVLVNGRCAGLLHELPNGFEFVYDAAYLADPKTLSISVILPKQPEPYRSTSLFPFFCGLLAEGGLMKAQCRVLKLDERDEFSRLLETCRDTVGAVTVEPLTLPC